MQDPNEILPPSVSGLVYNQTASHAHAHPKAGKKYFDVKTILERWPNLFEVRNKTVYYMAQVPKAQAETRLRIILVEGLFIYFFAKFCHAPLFM